VIQRASALGLRSTVMTFDPHPIRVLAPDKAPKLICTLEQRLRFIEDAGIELTFVAAFTPAFAQLSPEDFVRQYLVDGLRARSICVGNNFNFGHRQAGTVATLREFRHDFELIEVPSVTVRGTVVSSTTIRRLTQGGDVSRACRLLGRWFEIEGKL